jgi:ABC-type nitrate/sulfonate/bicarbonate transport system permease component
MLARNSLVRGAAARLLGLLVAGLLWELAARAEWLPPQFFPPLTEVGRALIKAFGEGGLMSDMGLTLVRTIQGLAIASCIGVTLALLTSTSHIADGLLSPVIELLRPIPSAAIIPIAIFFVGIGPGLFIFTVVFAAVWPIFILSDNALRSTDRTLLQTGRSFGCRSLELLFQVRLPNALPEIVTGIRIGGGMALLAAILVEMLAGQRGLGYRLFETAFALRTAEMFGVIILAGVLGIVLNSLLLRVSQFGTQWQTNLSLRGQDHAARPA